MKFPKKLTSIIIASLINLSCSNKEYVENEELIPIKFKGETAYLYLNTRGKNEYILHFYKNTNIENNLDIYEAKLEDHISSFEGEEALSIDKIYQNVRPNFRLIDTNGDFDTDLLLKYIIFNRYDTLKLDYRNTIDLNNINEIMNFFINRDL